MRITVVGAGVVGLLTAVEAVLAGHQVTVLDRGDIPNPAAASSDRHRTLRAVNPGRPDLVEAARRAHHRWGELEQVLGADFYHRIGSLTVSRQEPPPVPGRVLDAAELARCHPHLAFPSDAVGLLETDAGLLLADRVLAACVAWLALRPSASLLPHRQVLRVDGTAVVLSGGDVVAGDAVVLAAGPWSRPLLPDVAELVLWRQSLLYCAVPHAATWAATPAVPSFGRADGGWLIPPVAGTPLKISASVTCRRVDEVTGTTTPGHWRSRLVDIAGQLVPAFRADWVVGTRDCHYLEHATIAGPVPVTVADRVAGLAACGGASFKFAPLIARSLLNRTSRSPVSEGARR